MKSIRKIALSALLTIGAFGAVTYMSCSKDECKDVVCAHGTCVEGICNCPTGYEGTLCETSSATKFIGTWNVSEGAACGGNYTNIVSLGTSATSIIFSNLGNFANAAQVIANADGKTLIISNFTDATGRVFSGSGIYSGTSFSVTYTVTFTNHTTQTCTATFNK